MNFSNILNDLTGSSGSLKNAAGSAGSALSGIGSKIPGGLAGGALAGGLVATLIGSKSARKTATTAAKYGGAAVLGGLAFKAYKNWQQSNSQPQAQMAVGESRYTPQSIPSVANYENEALAHINNIETSNHFHLALVKAMIASARADGNIDADEQGKISQAIDKMNLDKTARSELLELFIKPISINDIVVDLETIEQKAEVYLASCLVIDLDHEGEYAHLSNLSQALDLPPGLEHQLRVQAAEAISASA